MLFAAVTLALVASLASADFIDQVKTCGSPTTKAHSIDILGCDSLDAGVCVTKYSDKIKQVTVFDGEDVPYSVVALGRQGSESLEIQAKPEHYKTVCQDGKCVLTHHYMIIPAFKSGKSTLDYSIRKPDGTTVVCYHYAVDIRQ